MNYREFKNRIEGGKNLLAPVSVILLVYIILFQFVLSANSFLPAPSLLIESVSAITYDYVFWQAAAWTIGIVLGAILLIGLAGYFAGGYFLRLLAAAPALFEMLKKGAIIPGLPLIILFTLWFDNPLTGEIIFMLAASLFISLTLVQKRTKDIKEEYYLAARSLGKDKGILFNEILRKNILPGFFGGLVSLNTRLWGAALIYEFIEGSYGIGAVLNSIYSYEDLSALILLIILIWLLVYLSGRVIKYTAAKIVFWEA